jgi:hypothetical protein
MQAMSKGYNITFSYGDETETLKLIANSKEKALYFFKIMFPEAHIDEINESIVQIIIEDLQPN